MVKDRLRELNPLLLLHGRILRQRSLLVSLFRAFGWQLGLNVVDASLLALIEISDVSVVRQGLVIEGRVVILILLVHVGHFRIRHRLWLKLVALPHGGHVTAVRFWTIVLSRLDRLMGPSGHHLGLWRQKLLLGTHFYLFMQTFPQFASKR